MFSPCVVLASHSPVQRTFMIKTCPQPLNMEYLQPNAYGMHGRQARQVMRATINPSLFKARSPGPQCAPTNAQRLSRIGPRARSRLSSASTPDVSRRRVHIINTFSHTAASERRRMHRRGAHACPLKQTSGDTCVLEVDNDAQIKGTSSHVGDPEARRTTQYLHQQASTQLSRTETKNIQANNDAACARKPRNAHTRTHTHT